MASPLLKTLKGVSIFSKQRPSRWTTGIGAQLPEEYKKFWREWKMKARTPVHYIAKPGKYERNEKTGVVTPVQNIPLPLRFPKELHEGIWGGETVVQGFYQKPKTRRIAKFWFPTLVRSVLYSEVLNRYMALIITPRTMTLIHENYGFDHYLLKTPACDLMSNMAVRLKREILIALADKTLYPDDEKRREGVYNEFKEYLTSYTRKEIEWYGLTFDEAIKKFLEEEKLKNPIAPLKIQYRSELIAKLKDYHIHGIKSLEEKKEDGKSSSWISRINPF